MDISNIGEQIAFYRKRKGLKQKELANKVGVTWEMISRYERGKSSPLNKLPELAEALDTPVVKLLSSQEYPTELNSYQNFKLPYYIKLDSNGKLNSKENFMYYTAPEWVIQVDANAFVVSTDLIEIKTTTIAKSGPLFISRNMKPKSSHTVLLYKNNKYIVSQYEKSQKEKEVVGTVLAQERRLI